MEEVAERCQVRPTTVYKWLRLGWVGSVRFGRVVRVPAGTLEAFIAGGRVAEAAGRRGARGVSRTAHHVPLERRETAVHGDRRRREADNVKCERFGCRAPAVRDGLCERHLYRLVSGAARA